MLTCFFDGACEPKNPGGHIGVGGIIYNDDNTILSSYAHYIPRHHKNTNNVAEYMGLLWVLDELIERNLVTEHIKVHGDSKFVIEQINGRWGINQGAYVPFAYKAKEKAILFKNITFEWVPRLQNEVADSLSKKELLKHGISITIRKKK